MLESHMMECQTNYNKSDALRVEKVVNGIVHPLQLSKANKIEDNEFGGVTDEKMNFIELSLNKRSSPPNFIINFHDWYIGANPDCNVADIDYIDEEVVFLGALPKHYGHFILEGLSRLWFCLSPKRSKSSYKFVYISGGGEDRFHEFFRLFGLEEQNIVKITKPTKFRTVIVPEQSIRLHDYYHTKYKETIDRIKESVAPKDIEKVYFSKENIGNNRAIGEDLIEKVFSRNGFTILHPENLSMYEMISILKGCKVFAATSATNVHNSIFMNDGNKFVCLNRSAHFHPVQTMIERMRCLQGVYVDVFYFSSNRNFGNAPCLLAPTKYLFDFFKSYKFTFNEFEFYLKLPLYVYRLMFSEVRLFVYKKVYSGIKRRKLF